jgi:uncharacterized protein
MTHFEIYQDSEKKTRFRLRASNGEIIATGESYNTIEACIDTIMVIKQQTPDAVVQVLTPLYSPP